MIKGLLNPEEMGLDLDSCLGLIVSCGDSTGPCVFHRVVQMVYTRAKGGKLLSCSLDQGLELSDKL